MATLEAAVQHISDLAKQFQRAVKAGIAIDNVNQFEDDEDDDDDTDSNDGKY
jgi:hypothetical protein